MKPSRGTTGSTSPAAQHGQMLFFDVSEPDHDAVSAVLAVADALVVSPYVVAELDFLVATRHCVDDELAVLAELAGGATFSAP